MYQVPSCFVLAHAWARKREGVKWPSLLYAVHVLTTMLPIMLVLYSDPRPTRTCLAVYGVWVALPLLIVARCAASGPSGLLFGAEQRKGAKAKAR
jgi:hypothetical protein